MVPVNCGLDFDKNVRPNKGVFEAQITSWSLITLDVLAETASESYPPSVSVVPGVSQWMLLTCH